MSTSVSDLGFACMVSCGSEKRDVIAEAATAIAGIAAMVFGSSDDASASEAETEKTPSAILWNPYVDELRQKGQLRDGLTARALGDSGLFGMNPERRSYVQKYAWAIPGYGAIRKMVEFSPSYVEIGAGSGYWARTLEKAGAHVDAYDDGSWKFTENWHPVQKGGPEKAAEHPDAALLLVWPPYKEPMAAEAVDAYLGAGGQKMVYVGEDAWGCTGDRRFHDQRENLFDEVAEVQIPQWEKIHDSAVFYRRSPEPRPMTSREEND